MLLDGFDPSDVDPLLLYNRDEDQRWLTDRLNRYLETERRTDNRLALCLIGEKGVGKSILTRRVLRDLRERFSGSTLFLHADCRRLRGRREVYAAVAQLVVDELLSLRSVGVTVPDALLANAQVLAALTNFTDARLSVVHEHLQQFRVATELKSGGHLLKYLDGNFGISLVRELKSIQNLTGSVQFDEHRLCRMLAAFFRDLRELHLNVVLYLDNIDELRHEYADATARERVRIDAEGILALSEAPIGLLLNMRTYYRGVLPREISDLRNLRRLSGTDLENIARLRLERHLASRSKSEQEDARRWLDLPETKSVIAKLAAMARTPLAFLKWFKFLAEEEALTSDSLATGFDRYLETYYSTLPRQTLRDVAHAFALLDTPVSRDAIAAACNKNEAVVALLQDRQAILPRDFWSPTEFSLDPELHFLHPGFGRD